MAGMTEKAQQARREYKRNWNRRNREKNREYQVRYWERKAAALVAEEGEQRDDNDNE